MTKLDSLSRVIEKNVDLVNFVFVYIEEAHPKDRWAVIHDEFDINTHQNMKERLQAAELLQRENFSRGIQSHIAVDNMDNEACYWYGALPERMYVIQDGKVVYQGKEGVVGFNVDELEENLKAILH